jgi:hypothetical protein
MSLDKPRKLYDGPGPAAPEPASTFTPRPRRTTQGEINRERRHQEAINQKLLIRLVTERFNAPDGRFARALMRIVSRNIDRRFAHLGLK